MSADGERWFLLNASPDVRDQLGCLPGPLPTEIRHSPVEGIVLTDAELDHSLGLVLLREARVLQVYATTSVRMILEQDSRILPVTRSFAQVTVTETPVQRPIQLRYADGSSTDIELTPISVPAGPPRFAPDAEPGHTVGLLLEDRSTGRSAAFFPGCGDLDPSLLAALGGVDLLLFDGTFWSDDELVSLGISERRAREMDHLPISGDGGSLTRLQALSVPLKVYTHINNTNPMLMEDSPQRAAVEQAGFVVGADGMSFTI